MNPGNPAEPDGSNGAPEPDQLDRLRELLLGPEQQEIGALRERLEPDRQAEEMSKALPQAVRMASTRNDQLSRAITPAVESALQASVRANPKPLTDAVFPIIGPAIRKAIAEAFERMLQSLNQTLEHSFSVQGLKWRFEAFRTGKSFAEVVLTRTLIYRVEQVFLIHRETGLLLQHAVSPNVRVKDTDMVSGMLTAIQDFARDSFQVSSESALETFQVGELNVWIETSPNATLAAVIRGIAPQDYRLVLQDALQRILVEARVALRDFAGDAGPFDAVRPILESCLHLQVAERKTRLSPLIWILPLVLLALGGYEWKQSIDHRDAETRRLAAEAEHRAQLSAEADAKEKAEAAKRQATAEAEDTRWANCLARLKAMDGVVVMEATRQDAKIHVSGLRDPLAADPLQTLADSGYDRGAVTAHWEPYYALTPGLVLRRAIERLHPPSSVSLRWQGDVLTAEGSAPAAWIAESRRRAEAIPGVGAYDASAVIDETAAGLSAMKKTIEETVIYFGEGTQLSPEQTTAAQRLAKQIGELEAVARRAGFRSSIALTGHTTDVGTEAYNQNLGLQRAQQVLALFTAAGLDAARFTTVSVGPREPVRPGDTADVQNRRVTFRIAIEEPNRNLPAR